MAVLNCAHCDHSQVVADEHSGKTVHCPQCRERGLVSVLAIAHEEQSSPSTEMTSEQYDKEPIIRRSSGGSIQTSLTHGIVLNKHSSLMREWITISDPNFPVELVGETGITTKYEAESEFSSGRFIYSAKYAIRCREPIQACQVRFLTFDLWGSHDRTLAATEIEDMKPYVTHEFRAQWSWNLFSESEASEFYASIAFIGQIRTTSGRVLTADPSTALAEAKRFSSKFAEADLEPTKSNP